MVELIPNNLNLLGRHAHVHLKQIPAHRATACNLVEEPQGNLEIKGNAIAVPIRGSGLATVIVE